MSVLEILGLIFGPILGSLFAYVTVRATTKKAKQEAAVAAKQEKEDRDAQFILDEKANAETDEARAARISILQVNEIKRLSDDLDKIRARMDVLESRDRAFMNILGDAARQWPADHAGPVFHAVDLKIINGDLPGPWVPVKAS